MTAARIRSKITLLLFIALFLNIALWASSRFMYAAWAGVPPVPSPRGAMAMTLGDSEFAFRSGALTLQGLGDGGGRVTPLKDYDFDRLGHWFWLLNALNPASEHVPLIAAYYFGVVHDPEQVSVLVDYLTAVGQNPAGEKWRWLVQAAFLARHRMKDMDRALDIAYTLSRMKPLDAPLPIWAKEFPAFILIDTGKGKQRAPSWKTSCSRKKTFRRRK